MDVMSKKLAFITVLATALALPYTGALARGGGSGSHTGGGSHMGGGTDHMDRGFGRSQVGGDHIRNSQMGSGHTGRTGFGGNAAQAFGSAEVFRGQSDDRFASRGHYHRRSIGRGFSNYDDDNSYDSGSCYVWESTPAGWVCQSPDFD
jgi:hypothetical protein